VTASANGAAVSPNCSSSDPLERLRTAKDSACPGMQAAQRPARGRRGGLPQRDLAVEGPTPAKRHCAATPMVRAQPPQPRRHRPTATHKAA